MRRAAVLAIVCVLPAIGHAGDGADAARGRRLFEGDEALTARIAGQDLVLPPTASRCINCHRAAAQPAAAATIGPVLDAATLRQARPRRGGPPSAYGEAAFCRVLRHGVDAASVIVDRRMPRYAASDADCAALWAYLGSAT